jgi:hypothetical protein
VEWRNRAIWAAVLIRFTWDLHFLFRHGRDIEARMVALSRTNRTAFRRAVFASVVLHIALGAFTIVILRARPDRPPTTPGIDTRADVIVRQFDVGGLHEIATTPPPEPPQPSTAPPAARPGETGSPPRVNQAPRTLPVEMLAIISRSMATQLVASAAPAASTPAIHGALNSRQTITYVLDCSGSMGEYGKFALARAALLTTLRGQPEGVQFQVIVYNSTVRPVFSGARYVPATGANIDAAIAALHETKGRSNHVEAVRRAALGRPDVILILTDADDLSLTSFRSALADAGKPIAICVAKVSASGVGPSQQLR